MQFTYYGSNIFEYCAITPLKCTLDRANTRWEGAVEFPEKYESEPATGACNEYSPELLVAWNSIGNSNLISLVSSSSVFTFHWGSLNIKNLEFYEKGKEKQ